MKRKRYGPDQIIAKLREADAMLGTGATIGSAAADVSDWKSVSRRFTVGGISTGA